LHCSFVTIGPQESAVILAKLSVGEVLHVWYCDSIILQLE